MYSRGQFAIMGKVGRKALRLYEEEGILIPKVINPQNGYHFYSTEQLSDLLRIKKLKKYGLTLAEIKNIMLGISSEYEILEQKKLDIGYEIQDKLGIQTEIDKYLNDSEKEVPPKTSNLHIDMTYFPSNYILFVTEKINLEHLGMSVGKLYEMASKNNFLVSGSHYVRYDDIFNEDGNFTMQTCLPITHSAMTPYCRHELSCKCLHVNYTGGFSTVSHAHQFIQTYSEENQIELLGTVFEVYNKDMSVDVFYTID